MLACWKIIMTKCLNTSQNLSFGSTDFKFSILNVVRCCGKGTCVLLDTLKKQLIYLFIDHSINWGYWLSVINKSARDITGYNCKMCLKSHKSPFCFNCFCSRHCPFTVYLRGEPICDDILVVSGFYSSYECMLFTLTHTDTHSKRAVFLAVDLRMLFRGLIKP